MRPPPAIANGEGLLRPRSYLHGTAPSGVQLAESTLYNLIDCRQKRLLRDGADDLVLHLAVLEEEQIRNRAHSEAGRCERIVVDVHFDDLELARELARELV